MMANGNKEFVKPSKKSPASLMRELLRQNIQELKMELLERDRSDALRRAEHSAGFGHVATGRMGALHRAMQAAGLTDSSDFTDIFFANSKRGDKAITTDHENEWVHRREGQYNPAARAPALNHRHSPPTKLNIASYAEGVARLTV